MTALAKVLPHRPAPLRDPAQPPFECPRCGVSLEHLLREVNLSVVLDDGAEVPVQGYECGACGWCCAPEP